jgi:carbon storage regulator
MLILARKINESIMIGDQVEVSVVDIKGDQVKLGINAPRQVKVFRREVYRMIQQENLQAARAEPDKLPALPSLEGLHPGEKSAGTGGGETGPTRNPPAR